MLVFEGKNYALTNPPFMHKLRRDKKRLRTERVSGFFFSREGQSPAESCLKRNLRRCIRELIR